MSLPLLGGDAFSLAVGDTIEVCILAGGLSSRMGRDKGKLRLGRRSLLGHVRANAADTGLPVRVIREDVVARCGPLGGIVTALKSTKHEAILVLACDMPFVSGKVLKTLLGKFDGQTPLFAAGDEPGFPLILPRTALEKVEGQIAAGRLSVHGAARALRGRLMKFPKLALLNINSPKDIEFARNCLRAAQEQLVKRQ